MNRDWSNLVERDRQASLRVGLQWARLWPGDKVGGRPRVPPSNQKTWKEAAMFSAQEYPWLPAAANPNPVWSKASSGQTPRFSRD